MKQKEIKIECPEGYEIDKDKSTFERIVFKVKEKPSLPKTWEELGRIDGVYIDDTSLLYPHNYILTVPGNRNIWPTEKLAEAALALCQLLQLRDRYNNGWVPDYHNSKEIKFILEFYENKLTCSDYYSKHRVLHFKTNELRKEFLTNFKDLIEIAKPLL